MELAIFYAGTAIGFFVLAYFEQRSKKKKAKKAEADRQYTLAKMLEQEEKVRRGSWESIQRANGWK